MGQPEQTVDSPKRRYVQVVSRTLSILEALNARNGLTASVIARSVGLPRGTAFRLAETLVQDGFLSKDPGTGCYWLTRRVLGLSHGYIAEKWIGPVWPILQALGDKLMWPVNISTPDGNWMEVRCATDAENRFVYRGVSAGYRFPMISKGGASVHLAFCSTEKQEEAIFNSYNEFQPDSDYAEWRRMLVAQIAMMRSTGYVASSTPKSKAIVVPLVVAGSGFGVMATWCFPRSLSIETMTARCLPDMLAARTLVEAKIAESLDLS